MSTNQAPAPAKAVRRKASLWATLNAVLWSFFGVRRGDKHTQDMENLNPLHVVVVGLLAAIVFIVILILVVRAVVGS
ncbi:MAG: DUF2970 domain-containing protein [Burkholderiaceae bacterium]|jgi:hypothetical protein